jgi:hypothetical protein
VPATRGMPLMAPVVLLRTNPGGKLPPEMLKK